ncbi:MAG: hypothetical protein ACJAYU_004234 [Bradymonadia bacterium]|jgi:hypothetical protein
MGQLFNALPMRLDVTAAIALALTGTACATRVAAPENTMIAYADAVDRGDWSQVYGLVGDEIRRGLSEVEFAEFCASNEALLSEQASAIRGSVERGETEVHASIPVDRIRSVDTTYVGESWRLTEQVPLLDGADTPVESMSALAAALQSDGVVQLLSLLSDDAEDRYLAEIDAIVEALLDSDERALSVYGDSASISIGEITINLVKESGSWHVSSVAQPPTYDSYYYDDW